MATLIAARTAAVHCHLSIMCVLNEVFASTQSIHCIHTPQAHVTGLAKTVHMHCI
jgi:hypothetical protein